MKRRIPLTVISILIVVLSGFVCILALVPGAGTPQTFTSLWGEDINLYGQGLYALDSHSYAIQAKAQDWVTLILGIPFLIVSLILARRNSYRGILMLTGALGYFLYTYASYSFLMTYNSVFIIYVALFSLSLFGFIFAFGELDISNIDNRIRDRFPRRSLGVFFLFFAVMLFFMWMGRILPSLFTGEAPYGLESYTTLVIQALDLGIILPMAVYAAVALLTRKPVGYALSAVVVIKGLMLFSAITVMALLMYFDGIEIHTVELVFFPLATLVNFFFGFRVLRNVSE